MYKTLIFYLLILLLFTGIHHSIAQVYGTENGYASFEAKMPLNSYTGESDRLHGTINFETGKVAFTVPVKSIKTGKDKRDEHMYELLKAQKNPKVVFEGKLVGDFDLDKKSKQKVKAKGDFTLAETTRQITVPLELNPVQKGIQLNASWSLLITDYGLERPSFTFIKVNDRHDLKVDALLKEE
ncbi:YceI family protein [Euzebyella saccharophila]|uniref:YceI family protein n=1 Tax=Euzebyella saccharophila TaxID=679664 RepID=A0ABV8JK63_9FLAO|nr:YceI family protein [Euzebyella saccharophila]